MVQTWNKAEHVGEPWGLLKASAKFRFKLEGWNWALQVEKW